MTGKDLAIDLKIKKAQALMAEVEIHLKNQLYGTAINRLYYSCFHATKALLLFKDLIPKTHSGVVTMLHEHFVLKGLFDKNQAVFFSKLMQERMDDDYSDYLVVEFKEVKEFIEPAKKYLAYVEQLVAQKSSI